MMMVYVAHARDDTHAVDYYKIGRSKNPSHRMKSASSTFVGARFARGEHPVVIHTLDARVAHRAEKALHWLFRRKRVYGEWFRLDEQDLAWIAAQDEQAIIRAADAEWYRTADLPRGARGHSRHFGNWRPTSPRQAQP